MRKRIITKALLPVLWLFIAPAMQAQVNYTATDSLVYEQYTKEFSKYKNEPIGELIVKTALFFIDTPYVASTLETTGEEKLTVNLREFDCTTFVETCMALSKAIQSGDTSFGNYCTILQQIRYRNGVIEDYASRLHYVSDWINENEKNKLLKNKTEALGGKKINRQIDFMSTHPSSYKQLSGDTKMKDKIKKTEAELNKRGESFVIAKDMVRGASKTMQNGDIVAFSTSVNGLDFSHTGIIYTSKTQVTFIHASTNTMKVTAERKTLEEYCAGSKRCNGIVVLRLN
ncbi:N-acetylmuramoyl-L-alanine amidase-like domain-containing protein [Viscerimonas tarda]